MTLLFWLALYLATHLAWQRGWFWTETTPRWRDFVGFIALFPFAATIYLALFI